MSGRRLAVVLSHPTQYYSPWFRWMRERTPLEFRVFYLWTFGIKPTRDPRFGATFQWDVDLLSGYDSEFVPNAARDPGPESFWGFNNPSLPGRLSAWRPAALLLFGYNWASHMRAVAWARRRRVPIVFRGDSHFIGRSPGVLRRLALGALFRRFAAFAYVGAANRAYFEALGVPARKLFFAPHSVDGRLFDPRRLDHRAAAEEQRAQLDLAPGTLIVLFAGKLTPAKGPRQLLDAFLRLRPAGAALVFVGEGEEKAALAARSAQAHAAVRFLPFANQSEMPSRYLMADLFALPSGGTHETWGLAVNEAMHLGVPALVSDRVGCQRDLVTPGETGWVFRAGSDDDLRGQLAAALQALRDPSRREAARRAVLERISGYTFAQTTSGLERALASLDP